MKRKRRGEYAQKPWVLATMVSMSFLRRYRYELGLLLILGLGLWLRVGFCLGVDVVPHSDMASFDNRGMALLQHGTFNVDGDQLGYNASTYRPPLYPLLLAGIYALFGHVYTPVYLLQALLGTLMLAEIYGLGKLARRPNVGLLAAAVCAVFPPLIGYCGILLSETLFFALLLAAVGMLLAGLQSGRMKTFVAAGILFGFAGLARPVGLLTGLLLLIAAGIFKQPQYKIKHLLVTFVAAILLVLPWTIRNYLEFHRFVLVETATGINLFIGNNDKAKGDFVPKYDQLPSYQAAMQKSHNIVEVDENLKHAALDWIGAHPARYFQLVLKRLGDYFVVEDEFYADKYDWSRIPGYSEKLSQIVRIVFQVLAILALIWAVARRQWFWVWIGITALFYFIMPSLVMFHTRYRHPGMPFVFLLGCQSLMLAWDWLMTTYRSQSTPRGPLHGSASQC